MPGLGHFFLKKNTKGFSYTISFLGTALTAAVFFYVGLKEYEKAGWKFTDLFTDSSLFSQPVSSLIFTAMTSALFSVIIYITAAIDASISGVLQKRLLQVNRKIEKTGIYFTANGICIRKYF